MTITIRRMAASDILAVSEIVAADYRLLAASDGFTAEQLHRLLTERCTVNYNEGWLTRWNCYVAVSETSVVGAVAIDRHEIAELWVNPDYHRQYIGTALFRHAEQQIREAGHALLTLRCATHTAKPFYLAMGCQVKDVRLCVNGPLEGRPITCYTKSLTER